MSSMIFKLENSKVVLMECRERGKKNQKSKCKIRLPPACKVYCGETLRDEIMGNNLSDKISVCDCIIFISPTKVSLVELKGGTPDTKILRQFNGGVEMLKRILKKRRPICFQAVLVTNRDFANRSEKMIVHKKPLSSVTPNVRIHKEKCGNMLPDKFISNCTIG